MERIILKPKESRRLLRGHVWAYQNELAEIPQVPDGAVVDVYSHENRFVGCGFYQAQGGIAVRILSRRQRAIDGPFLADRIRRALAFRERLFPGEDVYRWVFAESDGLPGFVADRYGPVVSAATSCAFYENHIEALEEAFRNASGVEGLRLEICRHVRTLGQAPAQVNCAVNGLSFTVHLSEGQKTGAFLDQRVNCLAMRPFAPGARVFDGCCYAGLWSCHAARFGAAHVFGVDTSAPAIESARMNAAQNGFSETCSFECADVAEVLARDVRYDVVLLDPPALAKSRTQVAKAARLYQSLNATAIQAVEPGGILITSCCSHFVERAAFLEALKRAASSAGRQAWILETRGAAPDHPVLMAMPETEYLSCVVLRVL